MLAGTRRPGFTLVELLVVISIIALLISILLPALKNARNVTRGTICLSRHKQVVLGLILYGQDNQGWTPKPYDSARDAYYGVAYTGSDAWPTFGGRLYALDYITDNQIFTCPSIDNPGHLPAWDKAQNNLTPDNWTQRKTFGLRLGIPSTSGYTVATDMNQIANPSDYFLTTDTTYVRDPYNTQYYLGQFYLMDGGKTVYLAHGGLASASYADGSARLTEATYFREEVIWGPRWAMLFYDPNSGVFDNP